MNDFANLFLKVLELSGLASVVILFVLAARLPLRKAPKIFSYALWAIVLIRLLIPVGISSPVSIIPEMPALDSDVINAVLPEIEFETPSDRQENLLSLQNASENGGVVVQVSRGLEPACYLSMIWGAGMVVMILYSILSYGRVRREARVSVPLRENIFIADDIKSPFVIGLFRPRIYLPSNLGEREQAYILLHEQHHIRRFDHVVKALAFLALTIHWFNPLVWLAFILSARDMEMSCDEAVIRKAGEDIRAEYSASLLTLATGRRIIAGTPLAFGEGDPKSRIRNLANWKRPAFWVMITATVLCCVLAVCLLTSPAVDGESTASVFLDESIHQAILAHNYRTRYEGLCQTASFQELSREENGIISESGEKEIDEVTVYGLALHQVYSLEDGELVEVAGSHIPVALTFRLDESGEYVLTEYWEPRDGSYYASDIKAKFPSGVWPDTQKYVYIQENRCLNEAKIYYGLDAGPGYSLGVTLSVENVTPTGLTIVCTQSGGSPRGTLVVGGGYVLYSRENGSWSAIQPIPESFSPTAEDQKITMEGITRWDLDWSALYGELPPGQYALSHVVVDFRSEDDFDADVFDVEFSIE